MPQVSCCHCGVGYTRPPSQLKVARTYCSRACHVAARDTRVVSVCHYCGGKFTTSGWAVRVGWGKYCSLRCANEGRRGKAIPKLRRRIQQNCETCGAVFEVLASTVAKGNGKFCSHPCYLARRFPGERKVERACEHCGTDFITYGSVIATGKGRFCSRHCAGRARRLPCRMRGGYRDVRTSEGLRLEHRVVMEGLVGRELGRAEVVHHHNRRRDDNRPANLRLFPSNSEHTGYHFAQDRFLRVLTNILAQREAAVSIAV